MAYKLSKGSYVLDLESKSIAFEVKHSFRTKTVASMNMTAYGLACYKELATGQEALIECLRPRTIFIEQACDRSAILIREPISCKCRVGQKCECSVDANNKSTNSGKLKQSQIEEPVLCLIQKKDDRYCGFVSGTKLVGGK